MKFTIIKVSADGEQLSAEMHLDKSMLDLHRSGKIHLRQQFAPIFDLMDERLLEMNRRIMASNYMITKLPVEAQNAIHNVFDVLHGRTPGPAVQQVLDAQKAERDAELAKIREAQTQVDLGVVQGAKRGPGRPRKIHVDESNGGVPSLADLPVSAE